MTNSNIDNVIEQTVKERLQGRNIERVMTDWSEDFSGDKILLVQIVTNDRIADFDPNRLSSLVRHLRMKLSEMQVPEFPLVRFMCPPKLETSQPEVRRSSENGRCIN